MLSRFTVASLGLLCLYAVIDAIELTASSQGGAQQLLEWLVCRAPFATACILPMALVLSSLSCLSEWRTTGEWDALLGSGLRPLVALWVASPIALLTTLLCALLLGSGATQGICRGGVAPLGPSWIFCADALQRLNENGQTDVRIDVAPSGEPLRYSSEETLPSKQGGQWQWQSTTGWHHSPEALRPAKQCQEPGTSAMTFEALLPLAHLSSRELNTAIEKHRAQGRPSFALEAHVALSWAIALCPLCLPLLGLALGFTGSTLRQGKAALLSLALIAGYWVCASILWQAASRGRTSPLLLSVALPAACAMAAAWLVFTRRP
jgi:lipopolysaccharide export LptBFGC system permease protein LptF